MVDEESLASGLSRRLVRCFCKLFGDGVEG